MKNLLVYLKNYDDVTILGIANSGISVIKMVVESLYNDGVLVPKFGYDSLELSINKFFTNEEIEEEFEKCFEETDELEFGSFFNFCFSELNCAVVVEAIDLPQTPITKEEIKETLVKMGLMFLGETRKGYILAKDADSNNSIIVMEGAVFFNHLEYKIKSKEFLNDWIECIGGIDYFTKEVYR